MNIEKSCLWCGTPLVEQVYPSGRREGPYMFHKRQFCNCLCARRHRASLTAATPAGGRKRAQRLYPQQPCRICGSKGQRHHKDENTLNNAPENIDFLCVSGHAKEHWAMGSQDSRVAKQRASGIFGSTA